MEVKFIKHIPTNNVYVVDVDYEPQVEGFIPSTQEEYNEYCERNGWPIIDFSAEQNTY